MFYRNFTLRWLPLFLALPTLLIIMSACSTATKSTDALIGKWTGSVGAVQGLTNGIEYLEFFADGTVTARTDITNFVGDYNTFAKMTEGCTA
ncbi:MAG: hypothetical protein M3R61_04785 [Chloroflexota bacterium]|nr:hypothetical protein [Chloroflexota bacterium]